MTNFLRNRTALITGAPKKLGAAIAWSLAECGARVVINYRQSKEDAEKLAAELIENGRQAVAVQADVSKPEDIERMFRRASDVFGSIDILVNNAGPWTEDSWVDLKPEMYDEIMGANVKGALYCAQMAFPGMKANGWGKVLNISATSSCYHNHSVYGLAKSAMDFLTRSLALEFAPYVTVNGIAPGMIDDPNLSAGDKVPVARVTPLKRLPTFEDIGRVAARLCSPDFDLITGQTLIVDGGASIQKSAW